jgi:hypothetical protein
MFRFLDKRLYRKSEMTFDLKDFAFAHIGLSQSYSKNVGKIKEKLRPAIKELIEAGFLEPMSDEELYVKDGGEWKVVFRRMRADLPAPEATVPEPPLVQALSGRGVTPITARELVENFPAEAIAEKLEVFDWLIAKKDRRVSRNPAGYLAKSIRDDFAAPKGFRSRARVEAERLAAEAAERELAAGRLDSRSRDARDKAEKEAVDAHLAGLTPEQRTELEREAFASSELDAKLFGRVIVRDHVKKVLGLDEVK